VPLAATPLGGLDALLASVQMPAGVPVATVAIGKMGAKNAGLLAVEILAVHDLELAAALAKSRADMVTSVAEKNRRLKARLPELRKSD
jgi:phosphoribosylaminoimidazole carboxylase PurE protein